MLSACGFAVMAMLAADYFLKRRGQRSRWRHRGILVLTFIFVWAASYTGIFMYEQRSYTQWAAGDTAVIEKPCFFAPDIDDCSFAIQMVDEKDQAELARLMTDRNIYLFMQQASVTVLEPTTEYADIVKIAVKDGEHASREGYTKREWLKR